MFIKRTTRRVNDVREAGPVLGQLLHLDAILAEAGLRARARRLTEVMTLGGLTLRSPRLARLSSGSPDEARGCAQGCREPVRLSAEAPSGPATMTTG